MEENMGVFLESFKPVLIPIQAVLGVYSSYFLFWDLISRMSGGKFNDEPAFALNGNLS